MHQLVVARNISIGEFLNRKRAALTITLAVATCVPAMAKTILPDACGDNKVEFDIKIMKDQPAAAAPESGKALIVFVETAPYIPILTPGSETRFGLDGAWVGAIKPKGYFTVSVPPGEHHLCVSVHGPNSFKDAAVMKVVAEEGKTYYFEAVVENSGTPGRTVSNASGETTTIRGTMTSALSFVPLSDDEGRYRVKAWPLSISKAKH
jgi:hypothetical protein